MTQPSPADELRAAATVLRTAADAAQAASPLPWTAGDDEGPPIPYIALMHPGVGHATVTLLDTAAAMVDIWPELGDDHDREACDDYACDLIAAALAVARAITGSQP